MPVSDVSSELADAEREAAALRVKLQAARVTDLPPEEGHALVRRLRIDLKAAEDRCAAASQAHVTAARAQLEEEARTAREASARAREEARRQVVTDARAVVRELLPLVQQVLPLNARLEELRGRLGGSSDVPMPFKPFVFDAGVWLQAAKRFVGDA